MTDYDVTDWTDFVRNLTPSARREEMQRHLDEGCRECTATVQFLQRVVAAAPKTAVPPQLVSAAKEVFVRQPAGERRQPWLDFPKLIARIVYNSMLDPLPAGARATASGAVHLMYEAGPYSVDLRLERNLEDADVVVVGQIASREHPEQPSQGLPVILATALKAVAETATNEFGEFTLVYRPRPRLRLVIPIEAERSRLEIELNDVLAEEE